VHLRLRVEPNTVNSVCIDNIVRIRSATESLQNHNRRLGRLLDSMNPMTSMDSAEQLPRKQLLLHEFVTTRQRSVATRREHCRTTRRVCTRV